jgi:hypothetical protein
MCGVFCLECVKLRELKALKLLRHVRIVRLKEMVLENQCLYFVFEFMDSNLADVSGFASLLCVIERRFVGEYSYNVAQCSTVQHNRPHHILYKGVSTSQTEKTRPHAHAGDTKMHVQLT